MAMPRPTYRQTVLYDVSTIQTQIHLELRLLVDHQGNPIRKDDWQALLGRELESCGLEKDTSNFFNTC